MAEGDTTASESPKRAGVPESRVAWALAAGGLLVAAAVAIVIALADPRPPAAPRPVGMSVTTPRASAASTRSLTAADVHAVLADLDYEPSADTSRAAYDEAVARLLRSVDLVPFALATLQATPTIAFTDLGQASPRRVSGAEKDQLVAEAAERWRMSAREAGSEEAPLAEVFTSTLYPPTVPDRNRIDSLADVMAQGLEPLGLMFGARGATLGWEWRVAGVSVVGTDTAEVTYEATASPRAGFAFADPTMRYAKRLRFALGADGRWRLAAWVNYHAVNDRFEANLRPVGATPAADRWWGAL